LKVRDKVSKKLLLRLFEEGKGPNDPEVKELGYRSTSVHTYYLTWQKSKGKVSETKAGKLETAIGKGETMGGIDETKGKPPVTEAEEEDCPSNTKRETSRGASGKDVSIFCLGLVAPPLSEGL